VPHPHYRVLVCFVSCVFHLPVWRVQFVDENGDEVCPINWRPNKRSLNTKKADEFFASGATAKGRKDEGTSDATQGAAKRPRN